MAMGLAVRKRDVYKRQQYNRIQTQVVQMIREKDLRDDYGRLFGFGTHMYRHYYGVKLTEMHLDDWTIARLLGHSSVQDVYKRQLQYSMIVAFTASSLTANGFWITANPFPFSFNPNRCV